MKKFIDIVFASIFVTCITVLIFIYSGSNTPKKDSIKKNPYTITKIDVEGCSYNLINTETNSHLIHSKNCTCIKEKQKRLVEFVKKNYVKKQRMMDK